MITIVHYNGKKQKKLMLTKPLDSCELFMPKDYNERDSHYKAIISLAKNASQIMIQDYLSYCKSNFTVLVCLAQAAYENKIPLIDIEKGEINLKFPINFFLFIKEIAMEQYKWDCKKSGEKYHPNAVEIFMAKNPHLKGVINGV